MSDSESDSPVNNYDESESEGFSPEAPKPKAKPAPKKAPAKAPPKKLVQSTLKSKAKPAVKKRPKSDSDDEESLQGDHSLLSNTPPSAKLQKKSNGDKKHGSVPLQELENDSIMEIEVGPGKKKTATDRYQKLTQLEHILIRPDTYIGSIEHTDQQMWVFNSETSQMELRKVAFVPGLYKIFDEILVNAADNKQKDASMKYIKVVVDREKGEISVENDGAGIPVEVHQKEKIYIPEMIFGHLLTGSNYDDDEAKTTGGRNGFGAKLCNIFSTQFTVETQDSNTGKRYKQTWTENMSKMGKHKITSSKSADFTRVTFTPDFEKFKMNGMDDDFEALVKRRVYDMAGTLKDVKVFLNGVQIKLDFKKYIEMYAKALNKERGFDGAEPVSSTVIVENSKTHEKWQIGFAVSDGSFQQISFVNSIATTSGGPHVNYIADQICEKLLEVVKKKNPKGTALKANQVRNHIFLFVNCLIVNPSFASQTKELLTTKKSNFGSRCILTDEFLKKIGNTEAVQNIISFAHAKADQALSKSDGNRRSRMTNPKLVDANLAGSKHGHKCTLILTEGDSAKSLAVAGRAILAPDLIGVFPLRGKLLNVRDASVEQISKNAEIQNIKQFMGLKHRQDYKTTEGLRYGHIMIMADQDHDGSHIKGLLINFLEVQFPSLLRIQDFFQEFITPIVKVWKGPNPKKPLQPKSFFTMPQYEEWKESHQEDKAWKHKYFKGLGTSRPEDAQIYFNQLDEHLRVFEPMKREESELFELAFSKKKADARKQWLGNFVPGTYLDHSAQTLTFDSFVNKELILFSMADNLRSIPSVIDGLKPGQRKVMFACFKRNLTRDMKVVELAGYVSENTAYHHGETSLHQTIIGLAQNFVGSNNVNCLEPSGTFGSRQAGGSDAASPRYIFTRLSPFARRVFSVLDEPNLVYNVDDGRSIEPTVYCPVVPMVLINGADGIGTGWSTSIPNYHPVDVVNNLKRRMGRLDDEGDGEEMPFQTMSPWFRGWKGTPEEAGPDRFRFNGTIKEVKSNEIEVTELPIRVWTDDFKARLEEIIKGEKGTSFIKDYQDYCDHKNVNFVIQMDEKNMTAARAEGLAEKFKLNKTIATSNLVAFNTQGQIRKYEKVEDILEEYYHYRMEMYTSRKAYWLKKLDAEYRKLKNQARFVLEIIENKLVVSKKKKQVIVNELRKAGYEGFPKIKDAQKAGEREAVVENDEDDQAEDDTGAKDYDYLLSMPIWSLTQERVDKLKDQMTNKRAEYDQQKSVSEKDMWCQDLDAFLLEWEAQLKEDNDYERSVRSMGRRASRKIGAGGKGAGKGRVKGDDDYTESKPKAKAAAPKAAQPKAHQRFLDMFSPKGDEKAKAPSKVDEESGLSDDDFAVLASKPAAKPAVTSNRTKRAAAPMNWLGGDDSSETSDDGKLLGDVSGMVKGINAGAKTGAPPPKSRVSLFAMSHSEGTRPGSSSGLPKLKGKASRNFEESDHDETNYEMLARSSPHKAPPAARDLDSFLSDEDSIMTGMPKKSAAKAPIKKAVTKTVPKQKKAVEPKKQPTTAKAALLKQLEMLDSSDEGSEDAVRIYSPASIARANAKALALMKQNKPKPPAPNPVSEDDLGMSDPSDSPQPRKVAPSKAAPVKRAAKAAPKKQAVVSEDEDEDEEMMDADSPPPKPAARGRPARAAVTKAKKVVYDDDSDDDDSSESSSQEASENEDSDESD